MTHLIGSIIQLPQFLSRNIPPRCYFPGYHAHLVLIKRLPNKKAERQLTDSFPFLTQTWIMHIFRLDAQHHLCEHCHHRIFYSDWIWEYPTCYPVLHEVSPPYRLQRVAPADNISFRWLGSRPSSTRNALFV